MANILAKRLKLAKKEHKIRTKLLGIKNSKVYIVKRDGSSQKFITLAVFDYYDMNFDNYRHSDTIAFAVAQNETFTRGETTRTMRQVAEIASHIAIVKTDGESIMFSIRDGDEFEPFYFDSTFKFYIKQISDRFDPEANV